MNSLVTLISSIENKPEGQSTIAHLANVGAIAVRVISELRRLLAMQAKAESWIPISERMPTPDQIVLVIYVDESGRRSVVRSGWCPKFYMEDEGDYDNEGDYNEETDATYWPEGWYEWNHYEETHWMLSPGTVSHWMPLPELPAVVSEDE